MSTPPPLFPGAAPAPADTLMQALLPVLEAHALTVMDRYLVPPAAQQDLLVILPGELARALDEDGPGEEPWDLHPEAPELDLHLVLPEWAAGEAPEAWTRRVVESWEMREAGGEVTRTMLTLRVILEQAWEGWWQEQALVTARLQDAGGWAVLLSEDADPEGPLSTDTGPP